MTTLRKWEAGVYKHGKDGIGVIAFVDWAWDTKVAFIAFSGRTGDHGVSSLDFSEVCSLAAIALYRYSFTVASVPALGTRD
jgi:hypothetical protein